MQCQQKILVLYQTPLSTSQVEADNKLELGLTVLDEPSAKQSDPNIIELQLRSVTKTTNSRMSKIKKVKNVEAELKVVEKWIKDIDDLHRSKPAPTIQYSKPMPEIDQLMQVQGALSIVSRTFIA